LREKKGTEAYYGVGKIAVISVYWKIRLFFF